MIKKVTGNTSLADWEAIARKCNYATFFHTPRWSQVFTDTYDSLESLACRFTFDDGKTAMLPLMKAKSRLPLFDTYASGVAGVYGGAISGDNLSLDQHMEILKWAGRSLKAFQLRINPFDDSIKNLKWSNYSPDFTHALDLRKGFDDIFHSWSKGHRSAVKQAVRSGIEIREATTIGQWHDYYGMYLKSIARWGKNASSMYPWKLFENMFSYNDASIKLWLAYLEDTPVSGALCFYHNRHVVHWHGAGLEEHFSKRPVQLLYYHVIHHAIENKYWYYDMNPSGGHESVAEFKNRFGTQKLECGMIYKNNRLASLLTVPVNNVNRLLGYAGLVKSKGNA